MVKKMLIDATHAEETRVVVVDGNKVEEFDFETLNKRQIAGNIYLAKVTRVEPSLQAAFVDYGGNRNGFLAFAEIHPDYYQIPAEDRQALLEEERALASAENDDEPRPARGQRKPRNDRGRNDQNRAERTQSNDAVLQGPVSDAGVDLEALTPVLGVEVAGREVLDHEDDEATLESFDAPFTAPAVQSEAESKSQTEIDAEASDDRDHDEDAGHKDHTKHQSNEIESIADEDVADEIAPMRKARARRYKIQEVIKMRQIMLVQVVKEERGNKGAALTTYLSLAGRYCVLMPNTARGGGISRKITQAADRKKLKEIAQEIKVPEGAGLIIRTAGANRTKSEIRRDYEYLMRLWEQVRELTLKSVAPTAIYEEGDLIKRSIRDLYNSEIDEVLVEGETGYRTAKDFMRMIMPSHANLVRRYNDAMPLFARFQVESYLAGMFNPTVQLKSGGYIVIGVTEALVAVDVNSGRATKEGSIEDTAVKTNLEAAEEVARQLRLRDLAGLIVIDFIDMDERRNNTAVEKRLKDKLKTDRARIQVGRISGFGLMEMSRQRLRPGMLESTTQPCAHCHGTGLIRSDDSLSLQILRALEEEGTRNRSKEVLLKAPVAVINFLMNQKREHIASIEVRYGISVRIEADPHLISPDYVLEKFKFATRLVTEAQNHAISGTAEMMGDPVDETEIDLTKEVVEIIAGSDESAPDEATGDGKKKRRRRRRRRGAETTMLETGENGAEEVEDESSDESKNSGADGGRDPVNIEGEAAAKPVRKTRTRSRSPKTATVVLSETISQALEPIGTARTAPELAPSADDVDLSTKVKAVKKAPAKRAPAKVKADAPTTLAAEPSAQAEPRAKAAPKARKDAPASAAAQLEPVIADPAVAPGGSEVAPKRKGWWNLGR
ncbi:MAG: Rne/Rng family ribonuclease [Proteobacteria bacterium]|nr:Rne/Rng family ribonuclease [Pseudomonadota bacterium]